MFYNYLYYLFTDSIKLFLVIVRSLPSNLNSIDKDKYNYELAQVYNYNNMGTL